VETSLYRPVKAFLVGLGYDVKGEVGGCDLLAVKGDDPPVVVIGELKLTFNLELVLQGVDRATASDEVWLAARVSPRGKGRESDARFRNLCRRLGFGLLGVLPNGQVEVLVSPTAPTPRKNPRRRSRLVDEHRRRRGDPVEGGGSRTPIMTAYRQLALACAAALAQGPRRPRDLKGSIPDAPKVLRGNVYGWFVAIERGVYNRQFELSLGGPWLPGLPAVQSQRSCRSLRATCCTAALKHTALFWGRLAWARS
jgi:hypothetical protein